MIVIMKRNHETFRLQTYESYLETTKKEYKTKDPTTLLRKHVEGLMKQGWTVDSVVEDCPVTSVIHENGRMIKEMMGRRPTYSTVAQFYVHAMRTNNKNLVRALNAYGQAKGWYDDFL